MKELNTKKNLTKIKYYKKYKYTIVHNRTGKTAKYKAMKEITAL